MYFICGRNGVVICLLLGLGSVSVIGVWYFISFVNGGSSFIFWCVPFVLMLYLFYSSGWIYWFSFLGMGCRFSLEFGCSCWFVVWLLIDFIYCFVLGISCWVFLMYHFLFFSSFFFSESHFFVWLCIDWFFWTKTTIFGWLFMTLQFLLPIFFLNFCFVWNWM